MALRVVLADDSYLIREAVQHLLAAAEHIEVVAVAVDRDGLRRAIDVQRPDVVVTDIRMPPHHDTEGVRIAADLRRSHPEIGVVLLSHYVEAAYALDLLADGSDGRAYLVKEAVHDRSRLESVIRTVAAGGSVIDPKVVDALIAERLHSGATPIGVLTRREREVLAQIAQGKSNPAIADALSLSMRAVEKHINAIFLKLELREADDVSRRVKAALMFLAAEPLDRASPPANG